VPVWAGMEYENMLSIIDRSNKKNTPFPLFHDASFKFSPQSPHTDNAVVKQKYPDYNCSFKYILAFYFQGYDIFV